MINNTFSQFIDNTIHTNIVLNSNLNTNKNIINTNIDISCYKTKNDILIKTNIKRQMLSINGSLILGNNKFYNIII